MTDVLFRHHVRDRGDEPPMHYPTMSGDCESIPHPKRRQHSKSLIVYYLINKLGGHIPIHFDLEGNTFYVVGQYSEHYFHHIGSIIR